MQIVSRLNAVTTTHSGVTYNAVHGIFNVPEEVGAELVRFPHWVEELDYRIEQDAAEKARLLDPNTFPDRLARLEQLVDELTKPRKRTPRT
ncbi:hypothetical protein [Subtercola vilae]|uniref:Uncharacterized protein n=1 Tax=Subtercola vilae TaxID=2056433 RepID=A0A4T2BUE3_9MICO|nr:hypothetical protein [Subtercola vilae]TIH34970.1 hypothetical protein D4765_11800 [Subtercola vilae]